MSSIGEKIRLYRKRRNMTICDLADSVSIILDHSISSATVSSWERGERRIFADQLGAVANALRVPASVFYCSCCGSDVYHACTDRQKDILRHLVQEWDGDRDALVEFVALYMSLPRDLRREVSGMGIVQYQQGIKCDSVDMSAPAPDLELIEKQWINLYKKG